MDEQLTLEIKHLPEYLKEEVKDFVRFLNSKLENDPSKYTTTKKTRKAGFLKGSFTMPENFDEPLEDFKDYM